MDKMILLDIETQNFPVESGIYEVSCLVIENYEIVDSLYLGKAIPDYQGQRRYGHGFYNISQDEESIKTFKEFLIKYPYPLVAHNCYFDRKFLVHYKWLHPHYHCYCSIEALKNSKIYFPSYALDNLIKSLKIETNLTHTAMEDTLNLYKILKILKPTVWKKLYSR